MAYEPSITALRLLSLPPGARLLYDPASPVPPDVTNSGSWLSGLLRALRIPYARVPHSWLAPTHSAPSDRRRRGRPPSIFWILAPSALLTPKRPGAVARRWRAALSEFEPFTGARLAPGVTLVLPPGVSSRVYDPVEEPDEYFLSTLLSPTPAASFSYAGSHADASLNALLDRLPRGAGVRLTLDGSAAWDRPPEPLLDDFLEVRVPGSNDCVDFWRVAGTKVRPNARTSSQWAYTLAAQMGEGRSVLFPPNAYEPLVAALCRAVVRLGKGPASRRRLPDGSIRVWAGGGQPDDTETAPVLRRGIQLSVEAGLHIDDFPHVGRKPAAPVPEFPADGVLYFSPSAERAARGLFLRLRRQGLSVRFGRLPDRRWYIVDDTIYDRHQAAIRRPPEPASPPEPRA